MRIPDEFLSELWENFNVSFYFLFIFAFEDILTFSCNAGELKICIEQPRCWKTPLGISFCKRLINTFFPSDKQHHFPDAIWAGVHAWIRVLETDRHIGALSDRKLTNFQTNTRFASARAPRRLVRNTGSLNHTDVDRPELWNGVVAAETKDGSSTSPTRSTVRHSPIIASERPQKRRTQDLLVPSTLQLCQAKTGSTPAATVA